MKKVTVDEKLESLVDETGAKYEGKEFWTITAWVFAGQSSSDAASSEAQLKLADLAEQNHADAYQLIYVNIFDSRQEYDPAPYTAAATAILYKSK
ncbi:hypothetical protein HY494_02360 [Candidatus Woesearchaeota archaeon]|nr:hypothetical protein [Candidatus Woesearchaeota archaeon]